MPLTAPFVTGQPTTFRQIRRMAHLMGIREGTDGGLAVTQRGAGANMSVDVSTGNAFVQIDTGTRNGIVHVENDAVANVVIPAADATNPRVDQVVLQYNDSAIPAGVGGNTPTLRVVQGSPTSGANLSNRNGAGALPNDALRLADVLVAARATSIVSANIQDRRPMAHGVRSRRVRTATLADVGTWTAIPELAVTAEFTRTVKWSLTVVGQGPGGPPIQFFIYRDGVEIAPGSPSAGFPHGVGANSNIMTMSASDWDTPSPGRHTYQVWYHTPGSDNMAALFAAFTIEEFPN